MKFWILGTKEKRPSIEFRVYPKEGLDGMGQNQIILLLGGFSSM